MGWLSFTDDQDDWAHEHEGYVQGVVRADFGWRDLGIDDRQTFTSHEFRIQIA